MIMIGDSAKDDVRAGRRAGAITVLLGDETKREDLTDEFFPDYKIKDLTEFNKLLEKEFELLLASEGEAMEVGAEGGK